MTFCCRKKSFGPDRPFRPDYGEILTLKFWARHDQLESDPTIAELAKVHEKSVQKRMFYDARNEYRTPITENQMYGWLDRYRAKYDEKERALFEYRRAMSPDLAILQVVYRELANQRKALKK